METHLFSKVQFYCEKKPTLVIKIGSDNRVVINGRPFSRVIVHIGDATSYTSLKSLAEEDTAVLIVDPIAYAALNIVQELKENPNSLGRSVGRDITLKNTLLSFYNAVCSEDKERILNEYLKLWEKAKKNIDNLFIINTGIDELLAPAAFADEVTYNYPYRQDTLESSFLFAMHALREGGKFMVITEMYAEGVNDSYPRHDFVSQIKKLARKDGDQVSESIISRKPGQGPFYSGYDMVFDKKEPRIVTVTRRQGVPPKWQGKWVRKNHYLRRRARWAAHEL